MSQHVEHSTGDLQGASPRDTQEYLCRRLIAGRTEVARGIWRFFCELVISFVSITLSVTVTSQANRQSTKHDFESQSYLD